MRLSKGKAVPQADHFCPHLQLLLFSAAQLGLCSTAPFPTKQILLGVSVSSEQCCYHIHDDDPADNEECIAAAGGIWKCSLDGHLCPFGKIGHSAMQLHLSCCLPYAMCFVRAPLSGHHDDHTRQQVLRHQNGSICNSRVDLVFW